MVTRPDVVVATYCPEHGAPFDLKFQATASATDSGGGIWLMGVEGNNARLHLTIAELQRWLAAARAAEVDYRRMQVLSN